MESTEPKTRRQLIDDAEARVDRAYTQLAAKKNRAARTAADLIEASEAADAAAKEVDEAEKSRDAVLNDRNSHQPKDRAVDADFPASGRARTIEERKAALIEQLTRQVTFASEAQPATAEMGAVWLWPSKRQALKLREDGWHIQAFTTKEIQDVLTVEDITAMLAQPNWHRMQAVV